MANLFGSVFIQRVLNLVNGNKLRNFFTFDPTSLIPKEKSRLQRQNRRVIPNYASLILSHRPLIFWRLNDTGSVAVDSSGNGNDGVYGPGTTFAQRPLHNQGLPCVFFNKTAKTDVGRVYIDNFNRRNSFSYEFWMQMDPVGGENSVVVSHPRVQDGATSLAYNQLMLHISPTASEHDCLDWYMNDVEGIDKYPLTPYFINDGKVHHIVCTVDHFASPIVRIYIDGKFSRSLDNADWDAQYPAVGAGEYERLCLGGRADPDGGSVALGQGTQAKFADFAYYDYTLNEEEIFSHYEAAQFVRDAPINSYSSLVMADNPCLYWRFNQITQGTTLSTGVVDADGNYISFLAPDIEIVRDVSGFGNDAIISRQPYDIGKPIILFGGAYGTILSAANATFTISVDHGIPTVCNMGVTLIGRTSYTTKLNALLNPLGATATLIGGAIGGYIKITSDSANGTLEISNVDGKLSGPFGTGSSSATADGGMCMSTTNTTNTYLQTNQPSLLHTGEGASFRWYNYTNPNVHTHQIAQNMVWLNPVTGGTTAATTKAFMGMPQNKITVEMWFKISSESHSTEHFGDYQDMSLISYSSDGQANAMLIYLTNDVIWLYIGSESKYFRMSAAHPGIRDGRVHHIVMTYKGNMSPINPDPTSDGTWQCFIDGESIGTRSAGFGPLPAMTTAQDSIGSGILCVGIEQDSKYEVGVQGQFPVGATKGNIEATIQEVAIYPNILPATRIKEHYLVGSQGVSVPLDTSITTVNDRIVTSGKEFQMFIPTRLILYRSTNYTTTDEGWQNLNVDKVEENVNGTARMEDDFPYFQVPEDGIYTMQVQVTLSSFTGFETRAIASIWTCQEGNGEIDTILVEGNESINQVPSGGEARVTCDYTGWLPKGGCYAPAFFFDDYFNNVIVHGTSKKYSRFMVNRIR